MKRTLLFYLCSLLFFILAACTDKPQQKEQEKDDMPALIQQIQSCSRLYTAECQVHKIITHDDVRQLKGKVLGKDFDINLPFGKRKIAIPMDVTLKAYIDFSSFSSDNISRDGENIIVTLPNPKVTVTSSRINHERIKRFVPLLRKDFSDEELSSYEQQGLKAIEDAIPEMGLVERARESAARVLIPMMTGMGYKQSNISITFRKDFDIKNLSTLIDNSTVEK